ncbi:unnamed protein product [Schistosoma bovis]|nr:unnamed protein product [Schistosoma bovis]
MLCVFTSVRVYFDTHLHFFLFQDAGKDQYRQNEMFFNHLNCVLHEPSYFRNQSVGAEFDYGRLSVYYNSLGNSAHHRFRMYHNYLKMHVSEVAVIGRKREGIIKYVRYRLSAQSRTTQTYDSNTRKAAVCIIKFKYLSGTTGGINCSLRFPTDNFVLSFIRTWGKVNYCLIIVDFNVPQTKWTELTTLSECFDRLPITIIQSTHAQHQTKSTHIDLEHVS